MFRVCFCFRGRWDETDSLPVFLRMLLRRFFFQKQEAIKMEFDWSADPRCWERTAESLPQCSVADLHSLLAGEDWERGKAARWTWSCSNRAGWHTMVTSFTSGQKRPLNNCLKHSSRWLHTNHKLITHWNTPQPAPSRTVCRNTPLYTAIPV